MFFGKNFDGSFNNQQDRKKTVKNCGKRKYRKNPLLVFILKFLIISNNIKSYKDNTENCNGKIQRHGKLVGEGV